MGAQRWVLVLLTVLLHVSAVGAAPQVDARLSRVAAALPPGWTMAVDGGRLVFTRAGDIYVVSANRVNGPATMETEAARAARIRRLGRRTVASLEYRLEPRWSRERWAQARATNDRVMRALSALPAKHDIQGLLDKRLSSKGPQYVARTDADRARLAAYDVEKDALEAACVVLPRYESARWSIFLVRAVGRDDDMHGVSPEAASRELLSVEALLQRCCAPED